MKNTLLSAPLFIITLFLPCFTAGKVYAQNINRDSLKHEGFSADSVSAVLVYNGVKTSDGGKIDINMVNSDIHVFTRLNLVPNVAALDRQNQVYAFTDITTRIFQ